MKFKKRAKLLSVIMIVTMLFTGCGSTKSSSSEKPENAPDTWIANRTIKGLIFKSAGDASVDMNPEIKEYIKEKTGITLELQGITAENSQQALAAGLAAGDLPDFIGFYLNNSGRPEMPMLLKASNEGMFHDLMPYYEGSEIYSKYLEEGYLPQDTEDNVMFRNDWDGSSYLVHMSVERNPGQITRGSIGGTYIRKDIAEDLGIDPLSITTSEQLYELAQDIAEGGYKDDNGASVTPIGPTVWGGKDRDYLYNDMVFTGNSGEKIFKDEDGNIKHESQTEYGQERAEYVQKLMKEGLMTKEFYTMNETRAQEGVVNGTFGIVSDLGSSSKENKDIKYIPLGPINRVDGDNTMITRYKSASSGWAIPTTTDNPEEIFAFADWLASKEGKLLWQYGLEGRDYDLDESGNPVVKKEVYDLKQSNPDEAKKLGFAGVGSYWGEHLGYTDLDPVADFGEAYWGAKIEKESESQSFTDKILEIGKYEERLANSQMVDGMTPKAFLNEFDPDGNLEAALNRWDDDMQRAYYAKSEQEAKKILDESKKNLEKNGIEEFCKFIEEKESSGVKIRW